MDYLIGVDIGTQGTKAVLIDQDGQVLSHSYSGYDVETPKQSWAQQWPDVWEQATYTTIKNVIKKSGIEPKQIKGVGISSLYGGSGIPVNKEMEAIGPCLIWMDRRAKKEVEWVQQNINLDELFEVTGNSVNSYFGFTKILWYKNNQPDVWDNIKYFVPPAPYLVYKLTGSLAVDYSSAGNIGGVFDLRSKQWSSTMAEKLGIPISMLPERLVSSTEIVGGVTSEMAKITGLSEGTPVVSGGVDAPVSTIGAGALTEGNHVAMLGTSMCWGFVTGKANLSPNLVSMPHAIDPLEKIYTFGGAATAGALMKWFKNILGENELLAESLTGINAYTLLDLISKDVPAGSNGLIALPYFMGERSPIWDSDARGLIIGLSLLHNKADIYKALMEGVAYSLRHNMEMVAGTNIQLDNEVIIVGGGSKSLIWPHIYADVTGKRVRIIKNDVEATLGDALLAGIGTGVIKDSSIVKEWLEFEEPIEPNMKNHQLYNIYYEEYKKLYENVKETMWTLANTN